MPFTSVIVTTCDWPSALARALDALAAQTRLPDEVIVADDGSGEPTRQLIRRRQADFPVPLGHVWQEHQGFRAARIRNAAIRQARGRYILLLDGDCLPVRRWLADHLEMAEPGVFVQGKRLLVAQGMAEAFSAADLDRPGQLFGLAARGQLGNAHHLLPVPLWPARRSRRLAGIKSCNLGLWRQDLEAVNGFDEAYEGWGREDSDLAGRLFKYGVMRKDHPFRALVFHLGHPSRVDGRLAENDRRLAESLSRADFRCCQGLVPPAGTVPERP
ncbi:MAG: glycosyltransferase [Thermodesulfobacteriota bacterium]